jgi:glycolate oxidase FAD binding subunit
MKSIVETLRDNDQYLAFEPPKLSSLYDGSDKCGTLGGVIATNLSGPRRLSAGAARDHLLGFEAVSGAGEYFKSGGRVVKNVTGFDLSKLLAGSFGTLAAMTSITVKVLPRPNKSRTLLVRGLENKAAIKVLSESLSLSLEVSGAAHLPIGISNKSSIPYISSDNSSVTVIRLEGHAPSVEARCKIVKKIWREYGDIEELHTHNTEKFWNEISGIVTFLDQEANQIWRISVPPSQGAELLVKIK